MYPPNKAPFNSRKGDAMKDPCSDQSPKTFDGTQPTGKKAGNEIDLSEIMRVERLAFARRSSATMRAYSADWRDFADWCAENDLDTLPADGATVALYIAALAERGRKVATISRRLVSIAFVHRKAGYDSPCDGSHKMVRDSVQRIQRALDSDQCGKSAMNPSLLRRILGNLGTKTLAGLRDRALLLCGFAGAMRRSELANLRVENLLKDPEGLIVFLPSPNTDQQEGGREVTLVRGIQPARTPLRNLTCPIRTLNLWLKTANIKSGPVFRHITASQNIGRGLSGDSIGWIIKRAFRQAGLSKAELERFSAHSLRAGFATEAYRNGSNEFDIIQQTGHVTVQMVRKYVRRQVQTQHNPQSGRSN
jgi:integrase